MTRSNVDLQKCEPHNTYVQKKITLLRLTESRSDKLLVLIEYAHRRWN